MWIEGNISSPEDWSFGISRNIGHDPELCGDVNYFTIGLFLFSISFIWKHND